jgi:hypothetical protein
MAYPVLNQFSAFDLALVAVIKHGSVHATLESAQFCADLPAFRGWLLDHNPW